MKINNLGYLLKEGIKGIFTQKHTVISPVIEGKFAGTVRLCHFFGKDHAVAVTYDLITDGVQ